MGSDSGSNTCTLSNCYNTGTVTGAGSGNDAGHVGGVVGINQYTAVTNVYNTGNVTGTAQDTQYTPYEGVGGIIGTQFGGSLNYAYNTGLVASNTVKSVGSDEYDIGGIIGRVVNVLTGGTTDHVIYVYYNSGEPTGYKVAFSGIGGRTNTGTIEEVKTTDAMKTAATFADWVDSSNNPVVATKGGQNLAWRIYEGNTMPLLTSLFKGVTTASSSSQTLTYNGASQTADTGKITYSLDNVDASHIYTTGARNAGTYNIVLYSDQQGYDLITDDQTFGLTIDPKPITGTVTAGGFTKVYDGNTTVKQDLGSNYVLNDVETVDQGKVSIKDSATNNSGVYDDKTAKDDKTITFSNITLEGDEAANYVITSGTVSGAVGQITKKPITATLNDPNGTYVFTKTYDGKDTVSQALGTNYAFGSTDIVSGDTVSIDTNTSGVYTAGKTAGNDKNISFSGITLTGADAANYSIGTTLSGKVGQITKKPITATLNNPNGTYVFTKDYDGKDTVTQALGTNYAFGSEDIVGKDEVSIDTNNSGVYTADKNVGNDKNISFSGITLTGADAANYSIGTTLSGKVGQITPRLITATLNKNADGSFIFSKTYDGNTTVAQALDSNYTLSNVVQGEEQNIKINHGEDVTGVYNDDAATGAAAKNAGQNKSITFTGIALTGTGSSNYTIADSLSGNVGEIKQKALTATLSNYIYSRVYDGTTTVKESLSSANLDTTAIVGSDKVYIATNNNGKYNDKNVATGKLVTFSDVKLAGADAGNYSIADTLSGNVGEITKKSITAALANDGTFTKTYDGKTNVAQALDNHYSLKGLVEGDSDKVSIKDSATNTSGIYNDGAAGDAKNVGTGKSITFTGIALDGDEAGNYSIDASLSGNVGEITKRQLTAALNNDGTFTKTYDGTKTVSQALADHYILSNVVDGEANKVSIKDSAANKSGVYDNKDAKTGKEVTFKGIALTGDEAGNYSIAESLSSDVGTINKKPISATITTTFTKTYDGTANVIQELGNNYAFGSSDIVGKDDVSIAANTSGIYLDYDGASDKNAGENKNVKFTGITLEGTAAGNYSIDTELSVSGRGTILPRQVTATLNKNADGSFIFSKTYDGTADVTQKLGSNYTLSNVVQGEEQIIKIKNSDNLTGVYNDGTVTGDAKNAGTGKSITFTGISLTGTGLENYSIADSLSGNVGEIKQRALTPTLDTSYIYTKTYDGKTNVTEPLKSYNFGEGQVVLINNVADKVVLAANNNGVYDNENAGNNKTVTFNQLNLAGTDAGNYYLTTTSISAAVGKINQKGITAALANDGTFTKTYDGTTNVAQALENHYSLSGLVEGDSGKVSIKNSAANKSGVYNDGTTKGDAKNVGTGKSITFTGIALDGDEAGNYSIDTSLSGNVGAINQKAITATLVNDGTFTKTYDGKTTVDQALDKHYSLNGIENIDSGKVSIKDSATNKSGVYNDGTTKGDAKNAGTGKSITFTGIALTGDEAGNYSIVESLSGDVGTINKKGITATLANDGTFTKTYDGKTNVAQALENHYSLSGVVAGDSGKVSIKDSATNTSGVYNDGTTKGDAKNVGTDKSITFTGIALDGKEAGNYSIDASLSGNVGTINQKAITATLANDKTFTKVYDGTATVSQALADHYSLSGLADGDSGKVSIKDSAANKSGVYNDGTTKGDAKNVGTGKSITFTGIALDGDEAGNYSIDVSLSGNVGAITKRQLTAALNNDGTFTKTYDGTKTVSQALADHYTLSNVVDGEAKKVSIKDSAANKSGVYNDGAVAGDAKNAGTGKSITFTGIALDGDEAGNYSIDASLSGNVGTINKKAITATLANDGSFTKIYDGKTNVAQALAEHYSLNGIENIDSGNVSIKDSAVNKSGVYNDGTTKGDAKNVGTGKSITFTGIALDGKEAGNYSIDTSLSGNVGAINQKAITATLANDGSFTKVYDGKTTVAQALADHYSLSGLADGDSGKVSIKDSATNKSGVYNDGTTKGDAKNVGTGKSITFTGIALAGDEAGNYSIDVSLSGNVGAINKKAITATLANDKTFTKIYDSTTNVAQALADHYSLNGIENIDSGKVSIAGSAANKSGVYNDGTTKGDAKNAGTSKSITFTGIDLTGDEAGNYSIDTSLSGNVGTINKKAITATLANDGSFTKTYDGKTTVDQALAEHYSLNGIENIDSGKVSIKDSATNKSGVYNDGAAAGDAKDAGTGKSITFTGIDLTGDEAGNYSIDTSLSGNAGAITKKDITATLNNPSGAYVFTKIYDGNDKVQQALGDNYAFGSSDIVNGDQVGIAANTNGVYTTGKDVGDAKAISFSGLALTGSAAGNYNLTTTSLTGAAGQVTRKTITAALTTGHSFDKVYDGSATIALGSDYMLTGVVGGDSVLLSAAQGAFDSPEVGNNKIVTFSGLSLNNGNYLLDPANGTLVGIGRIKPAAPEHPYFDVLSGLTSGQTGIINNQPGHVSVQAGFASTLMTMNGGKHTYETPFVQQTNWYPGSRRIDDYQWRHHAA
jgi:hypothetical protein